MVGGIGSLCAVYSYSALQLLTYRIGHSHQSYAGFHAALELFLDIVGVEVTATVDKEVKGGIYTKQQAVYCCVCLHRLTAFAVKPALTRVPQPGRA